MQSGSGTGKWKIGQVISVDAMSTVQVRKTIKLKLLVGFQNIRGSGTIVDTFHVLFTLDIIT